MKALLRRRCFATAALAAGMVLLGTANASADSLPPGGVAAVNPETLSPSLTLVADSGVQPFTALLESGTYEERVFREAGGTLDFVYDLSNSAGSSDAIRSLTMSNFAGVAITDVGFDSGSPGTQTPTSASRDPSGAVPKFFYNGIAPGTSIQSLILRTDATEFNGNGTFSTQDGSTSTVRGFQPVAPVPVPAPLIASAALLGLVGAAQWLRSRSAARA